MKNAGCNYVNYGIESLDQKILNQMGKGLTLDQIHNGVEATLHGKISPGLNFIWGFPGDTEENLFKMVDFLKKYDPCDELRTIRPVTPYPGCRLYEQSIKQGLIKDSEEFYEIKHKNSDLISVNLMDISTDEAHEMLWEANSRLVQNYLDKRRDKMEDEMEKLYFYNNTKFRGFRAV